jgi:hypothetical protein
MEGGLPPAVSQSITTPMVPVLDTVGAYLCGSAGRYSADTTTGAGRQAYVRHCAVRCFRILFHPAVPSRAMHQPRYRGPPPEVCPLATFPWKRRIPLAVDMELAERSWKPLRQSTRPYQLVSELSAVARCRWSPDRAGSRSGANCQSFPSKKLNGDYMQLFVSVRGACVSTSARTDKSSAFALESLDENTESDRSDLESEGASVWEPMN